MIPGVRGLFYVRAAALGWYVLSTLIWSLMPSSLNTSMDLWFRASAVVWLGLNAAELAVAVPFARGQRGRPAEVPAQTLMALLGVSLVLAVLQALPELGGPSLIAFGQAWIFAERLIFVAAEVCLWMSLSRLIPSTLSPAFYALLAFSTVLSSLPLVMAHESWFQLVKHPVFHWGRMAVGIGLQVLPLILLKRLMGEPVPEGVAAAQPAAATNSPGRDIAVGAAWLGGGLLVTLVSYSAASSSAGGGRYVVTTGAIAYGLVRLVRGLVKLGG